MMRIVCRGVVLAVVAFAALPGVLRSAQAAGAEKHDSSMSILLAANGAVAEGMTPGGHAIWFVLSLEEFNGWPLLSRRVEITPDDDRDGRVELELKVKPSSVWVAVDFTTGAYVVARPNGAQPQLLLPRDNRWAGGRAHIDFTTSELAVLLVRPGKAAWTMRCDQGGPRDGDRRADGNLRVLLTDMELIHGVGGAPPVALPHDLLVVIDPRSLLTFAQHAAGNEQ